MEAGYRIERMDAKGDWVDTDGRLFALRKKACDEAYDMSTSRSPCRVLNERGAVVWQWFQDYRCS